jgi:hypothetical protein
MIKQTLRPDSFYRLLVRNGISSKSGGANPGVAWQQDRKGDYMQTPIIVGDLLYGFRNSFLSRTS